MLEGELRKQKALFAAADSMAMLAAFVIALRLHDPSTLVEHLLLASGPVVDFLAVTIALIIWLFVFRANDLYRMRNGGGKELVALVKACSVATVLILFAAYLAHVEVPRITFVIAWFLSLPLTIAGRIAVRFCVRRLYANPKIAIPLVIVGLNPISQYLCDQALDELGPYEPIAFIDEGPAGRHYRGLPVFTSTDRISELAGPLPSLEVAIALPNGMRDKLDRIIDECDESRLNWWIVPWMLHSPSSHLKIEQLGDVPLIGRRASNIEGLNFVIKRTFDAIVAISLLVLTFPLIALSIVAIAIDDGRPVFFRQKRIGVHGWPFEMLKLRTMRITANDCVHREYVKEWIGQRPNGAHKPNNTVFKMTADGRITRVGRFLRRFSIDELPQLINVARGQMSLVGPRPALPYEIELYQGWHRRRLSALPGITGLWQVSGRNHLSFDEMVQLDVRYLEDWSFVGDLKILARTVPAMLRGAGL